MSCFKNASWSLPPPRPRLSEDGMGTPSTLPAAATACKTFKVISNAGPHFFTHSLGAVKSHPNPSGPTSTIQSDKGQRKVNQNFFG